MTALRLLARRRPRQALKLPPQICGNPAGKPRLWRPRRRRGAGGRARPYGYVHGIGSFILQLAARMELFCEIASFIQQATHRLAKPQAFFLAAFAAVLSISAVSRAMPKEPSSS